MPELSTNITFLVDDPLYQHEKPYFALIPVNKEFDKDKIKADNLLLERHRTLISDIRQQEVIPQLATTGFQVARFGNEHLKIKSKEDIQAYRLKTEEFLKKELGATRVYCWEAKLRENTKREENTLDLKDPLALDRPAWTAHVDSTVFGGPNQIQRFLPEDDKIKYLKPGYKFQIINTWRSLLPIVQDNPLAVCDYRSIDTADLVPCDRVLPTMTAELYYLKQNPNQKWYWLDSMTSEELLIILMYDSKPGNDAQFCPHAAVRNRNVSGEVPPRYSIETRNIVISKA